MLLREMTSSAFAHSFKRIARLAVAGLALAGLAACGGGGSSTPAATTPTPTPDPTPAPAPSTPPEIPITPAPSAALACFQTNSVSGVAVILCDEYPSESGVKDCSVHRTGTWQVQRLQQCPRSGSEYTTINECHEPGIRTGFMYNGIFGTETERMACEAAGGTFRIHKPTSEPTPAPTPSPTPAPTQNQPAALACFIPPGSGSVIAQCVGFRSVQATACSEISEAIQAFSLTPIISAQIQQFQQCPRSSSEYSEIAECRYPPPDTGASHFIYTPSNAVEFYRTACETAGGSFHIHQQ